MSESESYNTWLQTAYIMFAEDGPENFTIKELSQRCGLPRTNFYYYFENRDEIIEKIFELHFQTTTEQFNLEVTKRVRVFIPDLYSVIFDFKQGMQFTKQLFKNRESPLYDEAYRKGIALSADLITPKFQSFFKIDLPKDEVRKLWFTLTDAWFSRLNFDDYSVDSLCELSLDVWSSISPLTKRS